MVFINLRAIPIISGNNYWLINSLSKCKNLLTLLKSIKMRLFYFNLHNKCEILQTLLISIKTNNLTFQLTQQLTQQKDFV